MVTTALRVQCEVDQHRVELLYAKAPVALGAVLVNGVLLAWFLDGIVSRFQVVAWFVLLAIVTAARGVLQIVRRRRPKRFSPLVWERVFAFGSLLNGLVWGFGGATFIGVSLPGDVAVVFVVGGMIAGASSSTATSMRSFVAFSAPALVGVIVRLAMSGQRIHFVMGAMLLLFGVAMLLLARQSGEVLATSYRLRFERDGLSVELVTLKDVTEQRSLETERSKTKMLASLGTLSAGVAHQINNPLTFVLSNLEFIKEELEDKGQDREFSDAVDDAIEGAVRIRGIVADLRDTVARETTEESTADINAVLDHCLEVADDELRPRAMIVRPPFDPAFVRGDEQRLSQVFINLLVNAARAIPMGHAEDNRVQISVTADDDVVAVDISDTGSGIAPDILPRIFEPFFTTQPEEDSSGLGLSICHATVSDLGGTITASSELGRGSTFSVRLPSARAIQGATIGAGSSLPGGHS